MAKTHTRYPLGSVVLYNGVTLAHYGIGAAGILIGYAFAPTIAAPLAGGYLLFALAQMYVLMPLTVCPNCPYHRMADSRCVSAMNLVSRKIAREGDPRAFGRRAEGALCHNNLYMASLAFPIAAMVPALILGFSWIVLAAFVAVIGLMLFRIYVIFMKVACVHCAARDLCPNARQMGIS